MARIATDITWLIGRTPLLDLARVLQVALGTSPAGRLIAKLDSCNPTGSNKDRGVLAMIEDAERNGFLRPGGTIVECSGGDLALSVAMVGRARGYRVILTMPDSMAANRCNLLRALGAELEFTTTEGGIRAAMDRAEKLAKEIKGGLCLQPFANRANADAHAATARELWHDTDGQLDAVVCPVGTGGTAAGLSRWFHDNHPRVKVFAVEPAGSPVITGGMPGSHSIPGIGAGFVPDIFDPTLIEETLLITDDEAVAAVRLLAAHAQLLVGPAGGAVASAALTLSQRDEWSAKTVLAVLPDSGGRYIEHPAYQGLGAQQVSP